MCIRDSIIMAPLIGPCPHPSHRCSAKGLDTENPFGHPYLGERAFGLDHHGGAARPGRWDGNAVCWRLSWRHETFKEGRCFACGCVFSCVNSCSQRFRPHHDVHSQESFINSPTQMYRAGGQRMTSRRWPTKLVTVSYTHLTLPTKLEV